MGTLFIFVTLLTAVTARHIPDTSEPNYVPPLEQLEMIFGSNAPVLKETSAVETPALIPKGNVNNEKNIRPYQKKNEVHNSITPESVELNIKIKLNDCDKKGTENNMKQNPEKGCPDIHSRIVEDASLTDDRVSLGVKDCSSDKVRVGNTCVTPDP